MLKMDPATGVWNSIPVFDLHQVLDYTFYFFMQGKGEELRIALNIVPLFYFAFLKIVELSSLSDKRVTFKKFKDDNSLGDIYPMEGTVLKRVTLSGETAWLLVEVDKPFGYDGEQVKHVLVKRKDGAALKLKNKNQIVYFRLVTDLAEIKEGDNDMSKFPFVEWVFCR
jgi:hypothetical protein